MKTHRNSWRRGATGALLLIAGEAVAVALWVSGNHGFAFFIALIYLAMAIVVYFWSGGRGDVASILRMQGDERQRGLDRDATAIAGIITIVAAVVGAIVQTARSGDPGAFGMICAVSGISYVGALVGLRRRR